MSQGQVKFTKIQKPGRHLGAKCDNCQGCNAEEESGEYAWCGEAASTGDGDEHGCVAGVARGPTWSGLPTTMTIGKK